GGQIADIRQLGVNTAAFDVTPLTSRPPRLTSLVWRQDRVLDAMFSENFECLDVDSGLGQPHPLAVTSEAALEVPNSRDDLCCFIALIGQRHNHVVVALGDGVAVAGETLLALPVGLQDRLVNIRRIQLHPGKQRRTEVEADLGVVVNDALDASGSIQYARS